MFYQIIGSRGTGKTLNLILLAKEENVPIVCENPDIMRVKSYRYGITGVEFISYHDFWEGLVGSGRQFFVDDLDQLIKWKYLNFSGYTLVGD